MLNDMNNIICNNVLLKVDIGRWTWRAKLRHRYLTVTTYCVKSTDLALLNCKALADLRHTRRSRGSSSSMSRTQEPSRPTQLSSRKLPERINGTVGQRSIAATLAFCWNNLPPLEVGRSQLCYRRVEGLSSPMRDVPAARQYHPYIWFAILLAYPVSCLRNLWHVPNPTLRLLSVTHAQSCILLSAA